MAYHHSLTGFEGIMPRLSPLLGALMLCVVTSARLPAQPARVSPPSLPPTGGRYTHIVTTELPAGSRLVLIAGQVGADSTGRVVSADAAEQMRMAYDNLERALGEVGATWNDVLKTTTILTRAGDIAVRREVRAARFGARPAPANTLLVVQALYDPAVVFEVEAMAVIRPRRAP